MNWDYEDRVRSGASAECFVQRSCDRRQDCRRCRRAERDDARCATPPRSANDQSELERGRLFFSRVEVHAWALPVSPVSTFYARLRLSSAGAFDRSNRILHEDYSHRSPIFEFLKSQSGVQAAGEHGILVDIIL
jgi:hypothetical protein